MVKDPLNPSSLEDMVAEDTEEAMAGPMEVIVLMEVMDTEEATEATADMVVITDRQSR